MRCVMGGLAALLLAACANEVTGVPPCECRDDERFGRVCAAVDCDDDEPVCERPDGSLCTTSTAVCEDENGAGACSTVGGVTVPGMVVCVSNETARDLPDCE
jgi:hypothetical protein